MLLIIFTEYISPCCEWTAVGRCCSFSPRSILMNFSCSWRLENTLAIKYYFYFFVEHATCGSFSACFLISSPAPCNYFFNINHSLLMLIVILQLKGEHKDMLHCQLFSIYGLSCCHYQCVLRENMNIQFVFVKYGFSKCL